MKNRKKVLIVLLSAVILIVAATLAAYLIYKPSKPWTAFYIACCGGILVVNLIISMIFVFKNFKDKI